VRFLLINNHCISDKTAGVTQSLRTIAEWLVEAGHECQVLTTARFEAPVTFPIEEHLRQLGVRLESAARGQRRHAGRRARNTAPGVVRYQVGQVPVTLLLTRHHDETRPDREESARYLALFDELMAGDPPDGLIACNGHPMIREAMRRARARGVTTAFAVRGFGYDSPEWFEHVDHVFTCSRFLTDTYRERVGLISTPLEPPIDWSTVLAPTESRAFVTFVHPAPHKGLMLFARLAAMLGARRSDIPVLLVQSGQSGGSLNAIPGIDFSQYPQIMAAPPVATPAEYFALTRVLLVPSIWQEPFGRVAAEAMINGIPPLVSNRGALPDVVGGDFTAGGGGRVLPIPASMESDPARLPDEDDVRPWFDALCALWDDQREYDALAARAQQIAHERYRESVSRRKHLDYFTSLKPGGRPIVPSKVSE
jgi:glycosyltransferase involved in cell wall biosynthesis